MTILDPDDWSTRLPGSLDEVRRLQRPYPVDQMTVRGSVVPTRDRNREASGLHSLAYRSDRPESRRSANAPIADMRGLLHCRSMKLPGPAVFCLVAGAVITVLLWLLGERNAAIAMFAAEALGWAAIYRITASKSD